MEHIAGHDVSIPRVRVQLRLGPSSIVEARLQVALPSQPVLLSLAEVAALRAELSKGKRNSDVALMLACHSKLHGFECSLPTCSSFDGRIKNLLLQRAFFNTLRPLKRLFSAKVAAEQTFLHLNFVAGSFSVVAPKLSESATVSPHTVQLSRKKQQLKAEPVAAVPQVTLYIRHRSTGGIEAQLSVGHRMKLSYGSVERPPRRASALAAASSSAALEQELEEACLAADCEERERRVSWELALELAAEQKKNEELASSNAQLQASIQEVTEERLQDQLTATKKLEQQRMRSAAALKKARDDAGEWRGRASSLESDLYAERRLPDARVRTSNAETVAALAAAERKATEETAKKERLAKSQSGMRKALERERENRKASDAMLFEEREQLEREKIDSLRRQDEELRSNNAAALATTAALLESTRHLASQLERAKRLKKVQEAERLEEQLNAAHAKLSRANSLVTSLRRNQTAAHVTQLREQARLSNVQAKEAQSTVRQHKAYLDVIEEEKAEAEVIAKRAKKAHDMLLQRSQEARANSKATILALRLEVSTKDAQLDKLAVQIARREVAELARQAEAEARINELCARLLAGDLRVRQMQQEVDELLAHAELHAAEAERKHTIVEAELSGSKAALAEYRTFQAKHNGAYKDSVRLCYYSLIDKKVPTNQLTSVVTEVLKMVNAQAVGLPSRGTAQNMRREMGHVADVVAGVMLAKANNVTGASDDTTKRQRTLAADLAHFRLPDGTLRTLCIGLSCMSSGKASAKVDRYGEKMAQVQAAARLSVPEFHGDVAAFDRVTMLDLVKNWCSDRCITERNAAKLVEERRAKEARAREGARQLQALRVVGCTLQLSVSSCGAVGCIVGLRDDGKPPPADVERLSELETFARQSVAATMETTLPSETERQLIDAEMARMLGGDWWAGLSVGQQDSICRVWAATCNAHRWVNVGKGFDEGIKEAFDAVKAEKEVRPGDAANGQSAGSPWDRLIYELTKMLCMNARKMNVAIGQDLLGQQVIELGKDPKACVHTKLKVIVGERFLVTYTNAIPAVALESELTPADERLSALMEVRRIRKSDHKVHNRLESSVLEHYKDPDEFDALRVKAIVGHYLLHPLYLSTYHLDHILELNDYCLWVLSLLESLIADPTPLLKGEVHALQYWNRPLQHEPLLAHAHHVPAWGNETFLRMLKSGLQHAHTWTKRHCEEHLPGGKLDYKSMSSALAAHMWVELESHPIDNLAAERTLALDCYLTKVLGTRLRVCARESMVKWSMNVRKAGGNLEIDAWSNAQRHSTLRDAMRFGRNRIETEHQETARLHSERLPALRLAEQQFRVGEEKKGQVLAAFQKMRDEGREVQLALRHFLDGLSVKRSGKDSDLRPLLEVEVAKEVAARTANGEEEVETPIEVEIARLKALGFGKKQRAGGGRGRCGSARQPRTEQAAARPKRTRQSDSSGSGSSDESESASEDDSTDGIIDIDDLLQKDEDVYVVEKLLAWRQSSVGGREFLVKWKGYSSKETTWEPEGNILEKSMVKAILKKPEFGKRAQPKQTAAQRANPSVDDAEAGVRPEPSRARSSRSSAHVAAEAARRANQRDAESEESEVSEREDEPQQAPASPPAKRKAAKAPAGKRKPAAKAPKPASKAKGKGQASVRPAQKGKANKRKQPDSSDDSSDD